MSCIFPGAPDIRTYWRNIISRTDSVGDPPEDWEAGRYFDAESSANDRIYCKRGGYLGDLARFDPLEFGVMPSSLDGGEPDHYLALKVAKEALIDAGMHQKSVDPERVEVIVGRGTYINRGVSNAFQHTVVVDQTMDIIKQVSPSLDEAALNEIRRKLKQTLPPFNGETVPNLVPNVLTGRIANRLDFMGANYLVDAACASSLVAVEHGIKDLILKKCDVAVVGGVNASLPHTMLVIFCQINALSRRQSLRSFDESADGTMLGEGLGFIVIKRKTDAERDGDRIYAVIKSVGVASDGRALGLLSPRLEGEVLAIKRAYDSAGVSPGSIGLIEAHGTGTPIGDATEIQALKSVFGKRKGSQPVCALGTVKSMIGHLIPASGMAGLIKTALALYHKVLPPTLCDKPNPALGLDDSPFYINTETRPWIHAKKEVPRRAGVNAFGFGGINAHAILEEYTGEKNPEQVNLHTGWDTEVFLFSADTRAGLVREMSVVNDYICANADAGLKDVAFTLNTLSAGPSRLSIVAGSAEDLSKKITHALRLLDEPSRSRIRDKSGIYYFENPLGNKGKVAFLFPGEGSQYENMFSDLCIHFPEIRSSFDLIDHAFANHERGYLPSQTIFPLPLGGNNDRLWSIDSGAESVFAANQAMTKMMECLGISPDVLIGHSTGEYSALLASGMIPVKGDKEFIDFVLGVNRVYEDIAGKEQIAEGVLLSVGAGDVGLIRELVDKSGGSLYLAMDNCPHQIVLCGSEEAIGAAEEELRKEGAVLGRLPFKRAYHTPLFKPICAPLLEYFRGLEIRPPKIRTYSCVTAQPYSGDRDEIAETATSQWAQRVRFTESINAMYNEGVSIFIEVGPRGNLTAFVDDILRKKPYLAVASNMHRRSGMTQLNHLVGLLYSHHVDVDPAFLYKYRGPVKLALSDTGKKAERPSKEMPIKLNLPRIRLEGFSGIKTQSVNKRSETASAAPQKLAPADMRSAAMTEHLKTMENFINYQNEVLQSYMKAKQGAAQAGAARKKAEPFNKNHGMPFVREIVYVTPGKEAVVICGLGLAEDRFLLDHTLGGTVSEFDPAISALPVVPLTFSMEIMSETAALLMEDKKLIGMREVRAYRWIGLDTGTKSLRIEATAAKNGEVKVRVIETGADISEVKLNMPIIEGTMIFADDYPASPKPLPSLHSGERASVWSGRDLYDGFMFHGPMLRGVASMDSWGEDGASASLRALPDEKLFANYPQPKLLCDPITLDAAGQVIAYWTSDHLKKSFHIFPFRLEELHIYSEAIKAPETAKCIARIVLPDDVLVRSDMDIIDSEGRLRMRLIGWWDRRFDQPENFFKLRVSPVKGMLSVPWSGSDENISCCFLSGLPFDFLTAHDRIWMRVMANLILGRREREFFHMMKGTEKRKVDWLLGRAAVKDAVRVYLKRHEGVEVFPADIIIEADQNGRPFISSVNGRKDLDLSISISHSSGKAFAAAMKSTSGDAAGVDMEKLRPLREGFDETVFTQQERELISLFPESAKNEWLMRFWCAKEAVSKALGRGLLGAMKAITVQSADVNTGRIIVTASGDAAFHVSNSVEKEMVVRTVREGDVIFAVFPSSPNEFILKSA